MKKASSRTSVRSTARSTKSRVAEATRSVRRSTPVEARILQNRGVRRFASVAVAGVFVALLVSLVLVPVRDFLGQREVLAQKQTEYDTLSNATEQLQTEVNYLQTPAGVLLAARNNLNMVFPGERRMHLLPTPALPVTLPQQWPYTMVSGIVAVRSNIDAAHNAPLAPLSP